MIINVSDREFHTILAALRYYQGDVWSGEHNPEYNDIATNAGDCSPLNHEEIDVLCERINGSEEPELHYIIINKYNTPTDYWNNDEGWSRYRDSSTLFTEDERKTLQTPVDGAWVQLLDEDVVTCNCGESFTCSDDSEWSEWDNHAQNCDLHMPDLTD